MPELPHRLYDKMTEAEWPPIRYPRRVVREALDDTRERLGVVKHMGSTAYESASEVWEDGVHRVFSPVERGLDRLRIWIEPNKDQPEKTEFEAEYHHVSTVELEDGETIQIRAPEATELEGMQQLYANLSDHDRNLRFFGETTKENAVKNVEHITSLVDPESARDFVAVNEQGEVIGMAGYAVAANGGADMHVVTDAKYRRRKVVDAGPSIAEELLVRSMKTAQFDPTVKDISIDVLMSNGKMVGLFRKAVHRAGFTIVSTDVDLGVMEAHIAPEVTEADKLEV